MCAVLIFNSISRGPDLIKFLNSPALTAFLKINNKDKSKYYGKRNNKTA